jgi:hypothetical protein
MQAGVPNLPVLQYHFIPMKAVRALTASSVVYDPSPPVGMDTRSILTRIQLGTSP